MKPDTNPTVPSFLSTAALSTSEADASRNEVQQDSGSAGAEPSALLPQAEGEPDLDQRIREKAYEIWNLEGQPDGRHLDHWERAAVLIHQDGAR